MGNIKLGYIKLELTHCWQITSSWHVNITARYIYGNAHYSSFSIKKNSEIENLLNGLIAKDTITIMTSIYSIWPNLFLMTDFNLLWKASQESCSTYWRIKAHSHSSSNFKLSSESWVVLQTLLSRIDHTEKSRGFKSGLLEGHSSLLMNARMGAWIQLWVNLEPCPGCNTNLKIKFKYISRTKCKYKGHNFEVFSYDLLVWFFWFFQFFYDYRKPVELRVTIKSKMSGLKLQKVV